uniref:Reverse transcriptase domain-containing protein n=1 Tax=Anolis carolinensis TaxID=28377 RepID=A0A803SZS4_ANOCA
MVWVSKSLATKIENIKILSRDLSDHCPLLLEINKKSTFKKWRLNENLLKQGNDIEKIKNMTKEYFKYNDTKEMRPQIIWDAFKAMARGFLIQLNASKRKQKELEMVKLNNEIEGKEKDLKANPRNQSTKRALDILRKRKANWDMEKIANQIKWVKQNAFENANKPGKWLARLIRKKRQNQQIIAIKSKGKIVTSDENIREEFKTFYEKLYTKETINPEKIMEYLGKQNLGKITDAQRLNLNKEITNEEILKAINSFESNKAPGPDGFTIAFYKIGQEEVIRFLCKLMNQALQEKIIPETWKEAIIIMIPKENSDGLDVQNYRPISLLNTDYKIFTKILANRMKEFLEEWIGEDQTGFLSARSIKDNVRIIIDAIEYYEQNSQKEVGFLALDAEKAFDNLNWNFFKLLLEELDFGFQFQNGINSIYEEQWAKIQINGSESTKFKINKGTRQGCPLSPLIFIFALEVLLRAINRDEKLQGIRLDNRDYKFRAFADDLICIIENPRKSIQDWLSKIDEFGKVAGLKINSKKTKILTKNMSKEKQKELFDISGLEIPAKIKYLGIWLSVKNNKLLDLNYLSKWKEIQSDLEKWSNLNVSLMGRIAIIKMNVLPKMLYMFQNIPIIRKATLLNNWQKEIMKFIWKKKKARIKYSTMISPKKQGGFGVPDLKLYHDACALNWITEWTKLKQIKILNLEGHELRRGWHGYLWYNKSKIEKQFGNHFIRSSLIKIWDKYKRQFHTKTPLWLSPLEANHRRLLGWRDWPTYKEILNSALNTNTTPQLKDLQEIQSINRNVTWYHYFQIKESYKKDNPEGFETEQGFWDIICQSNKKVISILYSKLLEWELQSEGTTKAMIQWANNIGRPIYIHEWESIWRKKIKYSYSTDMKENWLKVLHRWYLTPKKIGLMYKKANNKCWRCKTQIGSYHHMWWSCKKLEKFWTMVLEESNKILKTNFKKAPELLLLGLYDQSIMVDRNTDKLFTFCITAARMLVAKQWKSENAPTKEAWLGKLIEIKDMDKLTFLLRKSNGRAMKDTDWSPLEDYIKKITSKN